ncbi:acyltransferase [Microbacterium sp. DT81.1]|uniref:acyltransferase n=1 Tax=Microbacterium sp. DT81.1 TaxID=3393413 RepID=UPI003CE82B95
MRKLIIQLDRGFVNGPLASPLVLRPIRRWVLRALRYNVNATACIAERCYLGSRRVSFAAGSFANVGCYFDGNADIRIGENVQIGMWTLMVTASHEISASNVRRAGSDVAAPINVGDGAWIGARCTVLPGVIVGKGAVVGAGSLVTKECEPDGVYFGAPAKKVRSLIGNAAMPSAVGHVR